VAVLASLGSHVDEVNACSLACQVSRLSDEKIGELICCLPPVPSADLRARRMSCGWLHVSRWYQIPKALILPCTEIWFIEILRVGFC
jgi:hypothetical protein